jgi:hypothetical protein
MNTVTCIIEVCFGQLNSGNRIGILDLSDPYGMVVSVIFWYNVFSIIAYVVFLLNKCRRNQFSAITQSAVVVISLIIALKAGFGIYMDLDNSGEWKGLPFLTIFYTVTILYVVSSVILINKYYLIK